MPLVSVLIPVYNGMPYLPLAVESIVNQTFKDFELIIVDDCSDDDSSSYLKSLVDNRIVLINLPKNSGITYALQEGLKRVKGEFIARMDSDDIAKPNRLEKQVRYLLNNPKVGLLGSSFESIDTKGNVIKKINVKVCDLEIRWKLLFKNPFVHSTVMFRYELIKNYQLGYKVKYGEDYKLWADMLDYCKATILSDSTIQYRQHHQSWTFTKKIEQADACENIAVNQIQKYIDGSDQKLIELIRWVRGNSLVELNHSEMRTLYTKLLLQFIRTHFEETSSKFVRKRLHLIRKRMGLSAYIRMDIISIYFYFLQLKLRSKF